jgi:hypothetical protein
MRNLGRHEHTETEIAVWYWSQPPTLYRPVPPVPQTIVLLRCIDCGHCDTETLSGHWTLSQVRGNPDMDELQRLEADLGPYSAPRRTG